MIHHLMDRMKSASKNFDKLKEDIKEQNDFIKKGCERIKNYYNLPVEKREAETRLVKPPHEILLEKSVETIELGLYSKEDAKTEWPERESIGFNYILIGVGTEILLKAIFLKEQPDSFIKEINEGKNTCHAPGFGKCKKWLINFLREKISPTHCERVKDILKLIQLKRNNLAHLDFHKISNYTEDYQVANVLRFLFLYFFKENSSTIVKKLDKVKEETRVTYDLIDYQPVEFDECFERV